jgi:hypothetical protein
VNSVVTTVESVAAAVELKLDGFPIGSPHAKPGIAVLEDGRAETGPIAFIEQRRIVGLGHCDPRGALMQVSLDRIRSAPNSPTRLLQEAANAS